MNHQTTDLREITKKYNIIYADPPWAYKTWSKKGTGRSADQHYDTMDLEAIKNLPVLNIADDNCVLFLWATFPCLDQALDVIKAWGFTYKTVGFTWVKKNKKADTWFFGMGYWTRSNAEICIIATKGKPSPVSKSVSQIIDTPIEAHSKKLDVTRELIVELCGDLPRIELFARENIEHWDCWGNQIPSTMQKVLEGGVFQ